MRGVWAVIPAFNEGKRIRPVIEKARSSGYDVLVVDDGSEDDTGKEAVSAGAEVIRLGKNSGMGTALRVGIGGALEKGARWIVTLDADGQHPPDCVRKMLELALERKADAVIGERNFAGMPAIKRLGNAIIDSALLVMFGVQFQDSQCGFRLFSRKAAESICLNSPRYEATTEIVLELIRKKIRYARFGIPTIYNGKKGTGVLDGARIVLFMLKWRAGL